MTTLLLRSGRVIDPARKVDTVTDVLIRDGRIAKDLSVRRNSFYSNSYRGNRKVLRIVPSMESLRKLPGGL